MKCELYCDNCLDLPSLTQIQGNCYWIHRFMGYVILESMIWFDLIWIDIPNLTENNIHYGSNPFEFTADLQATSTFPFHFHVHVLDAHALENFIQRKSIYWDENSNSCCCPIFWEYRISLALWKKKRNIEFCLWRDVWNGVGRRPTLLGTGMENIRL